MNDLFELNADGEVCTTNAFSEIDFQRIPMLELVRLSALKWEFIIKCLSEGRCVTSDGGQMTCALCIRFSVNIPYTTETPYICRGCPMDCHAMDSAYIRWMRCSSYDVEGQLATAQDVLSQLRDIEAQLMSEQLEQGKVAP